MTVKKLILRNWRDFQSVEVPLSSRVFVAGPNASGKSNLLDVFAFLRDIAKAGGGLQKAVSLRGGISKLCFGLFARVLPACLSDQKATLDLLE